MTGKFSAFFVKALVDTITGGTARRPRRADEFNAPVRDSRSTGRIRIVVRF
ncbi:hypothetical protein [Sphingomonas fennica]|uniref:hypothetical protein n=1 Tax=Edaphosphingomonas fennica TaxID=114404 RepID=UPI001472EFD3|nr:hypothetical protein [Sphingomonas fennica]